MPNYFRPAVCTAFLLNYFSYSIWGFPLPTFNLVAPSTSTCVPLRHPAYLGFNGQAPVPGSFHPRESRTCFPGRRVISSSKGEGGNIIGASGLEMLSGIVEFEEIPDASMSCISSRDCREDSSTGTTIRQDRTSSPPTLEPSTKAAITASSLASDMITPEEREVVWMGEAGSEKGLMVVDGSSIERLIGKAKQAAMKMEIVPVKSRADGRLDIYGQGLLNLVRKMDVNGFNPYVDSFYIQNLNIYRRLVFQKPPSH